MPLRGAKANDHVPQTVVSAVCGFSVSELAQSRRHPSEAGGLCYTILPLKEIPCRAAAPRPTV